jgi:glycosyltransferase involved in cell wall biosynthesis
MEPTVSVLIAAYNAERWLAAALDSVFKQTWHKLEVVFVDDGSTDNTFAIAKKYEKHGLRLLQQPNRGLGASRNRLVRKSTGDLLQYFDADDLLSPDKIEEQVKVLTANPPGMVAVSPYVFFQGDTDPAEGQLQDSWPIIDSNDPLTWLIELLGPGPSGQLFGMIPPGAWLTPRCLALKAGPWIEFRSPDDDGEYFARVVLASTGIRRAAAGRLYYRKHEANLSKIRNAEMQWGAFHTTELKAQHILKRTSDPRAKQVLARAYMYRAFDAYPEFPEITRLCLANVKELGGTNFVPPFGTRRGELIRRVFGWKAARKANFLFHRYKRLFYPPVVQS